MNRDHIETVLENVRRWPKEDQEELAQLAREIEARRTGVYVMDDDERAAIASARSSELATDEEVRAFWVRRGLA